MVSSAHSQLVPAVSVEIANYIAVNEILSDVNEPAISERQLIDYLSILKQEKPPIRIGGIVGHFIKLERLFRKSEEFTIGKTAEIFLKFLRSRENHKIEVNLKLDMGITALGYAFHGNSPALIQAFIQAGADVNCGSRSEENDSIDGLPLQFLNDHRSTVDSQLMVDCVDIALKHGCNPNAKIVKNYGINTHNYVPLWNVVFSTITKNEDIIKSLIKGKADVNIEIDSETATPLHALLNNENRKLTVVKILFEEGANLFATDKDGKTVVESAKRIAGISKSRDDIEIFVYLNNAVDVLSKEISVALERTIPVKPLVDIIAGYLGFPEKPKARTLTFETTYC